MTADDFVALCERLRAMGATEVASGELRAVFQPQTQQQLQDLPSPAPKLPRGETRAQREERAWKAEEERRARELASVGGS